MTNHSALIARLREATGADRELDEEIVRALYPDAIVDYYIVGDDEKTVFHAEPLVQNKHELPNFTDSIDAALTLVPEGWTLAIDATAPDAGVDCDLFGPNDQRIKATDNVPPEGSCIAKQMPLAICIAALEARAILAEAK